MTDKEIENLNYLFGRSIEDSVEAPVLDDFSSRLKFRKGIQIIPISASSHIL